MKKSVLLWPNSLVSYVLNEKRQNERKGKVKEFLKLGKKSCFKIIRGLRLNPKYKLSEKDVKSCGVPFASRCEFD